MFHFQSILSSIDNVFIKKYTQYGTFSFLFFIWQSFLVTIISVPSHLESSICYLQKCRVFREQPRQFCFWFPCKNIFEIKRKLSMACPKLSSSIFQGIVLFLIPWKQKFWIKKKNIIALIFHGYDSFSISFE